jgi:hypothetical protein
LLINDLIGFDDRRYHGAINRSKEIICQQLLFINVSFAHFFCHHALQEKRQLQPVDTPIRGTLCKTACNNDPPLAVIGVQN